MPNYYEETKDLLEKIEENTRENGGGSEGGGGSGGLTNEELRESPVSVTGPLTNTQLRNQPVNVTIPTVDLTSSLTTVTESGTITSGAQSISFYNYGPDSITVAGGVLLAKHGVFFDGGIYRLGAISYIVPSGTSLQIAQVR